MSFDPLIRVINNIHSRTLDPLDDKVFDSHTFVSSAPLNLAYALKLASIQKEVHQAADLLVQNHALSLMKAWNECSQKSCIFPYIFSQTVLITETISGISEF